MFSSSLPIQPYLDDICTALLSSPSHALILTAETAAGKSTAVPPALLKRVSGHILMLEPRRLATLAVASRVAELLGETVGQSAGYIMQLEKKISKKTRFTVMTQAVLTRRLQNDPALEGVSVVIIDEFHERSIHADLALAFLKDSLQLRDDLYILVMSATMDTEALARYLGTMEQPAPIFHVPGRQFPVTVSYSPGISPAQAVMQELDSGGEGSILVFLPGIAEIKNTAVALAEVSADVMILHSSLSFAEQRSVLEAPRTDDPRRVILSSAIAETSLTIPDVRVVIDSGLMRLNRLNTAAGMERLVTENESSFSAEQRAGRAGRTAPGRCIRLWPQHEVRSTATPPEIRRTDITALVLECALWGAPTPDSLSWLEAPSQARWQAAVNLLQAMGCLSTPSASTELPRITDRGKAALRLGLHPRLACVALAGSVHEVLAYSTYAEASSSLQQRFLHVLQERLEHCRAQFPTAGEPIKPPLLAGFPDRLAKHIDDDGTYQFPSGHIARLCAADRKQAGAALPRWIIAPEVDAGERTGRIYRWQALETAVAEDWLQCHAQDQTRVSIDSNRHVHKRRQRCYGAITLSEQTMAAEPADLMEAACSAVEAQGIEWLPLSQQSQELIRRGIFYWQHSGQNADALSPLGLRTSVRQWLPPFITGLQLTETAVYDALYYHLDGALLDKHVPTRITLPTGKTCRITYQQTQGQNVRPVMEIIIQQIFGCSDTPTIMGVPILLHLLSPARRPLQVTDDLAGFWQHTWPDICKEMKGRYPKHNWDYSKAVPENV